MAATALAGMFPPHERDGHRLVDGLALVPVPTGAVVEAGADIAVSVNLHDARDAAGLAGPGPRRRRTPRERAPRMLDTLLEVMDLAQLETSVRARRARRRCRDATLRAREAGATSSSPTCSSRPAARPAQRAAAGAAGARATAAGSSTHQGGHSCVETFTFDDLKRILVDRVGMTRTTSSTIPSVSFEDMGLDSLAFVEIQLAMQQEYGFAIPDEDAQRIDHRR